MNFFRKIQVSITPKTYDELVKELIAILGEIKNYIHEDSDVVWTRYETAKEVIELIDGFARRIGAGDKTVFEEINYAFAPTGTFQDISINNGWGQEYIEISGRFDKVYDELRKCLLPRGSK